MGWSILRGVCLASICNAPHGYLWEQDCARTWYTWRIVATSSTWTISSCSKYSYCIAFFHLSMDLMQIERALTLWKDGNIMITSIGQDAHKGKNRAKGVNKTINKKTG